QPTIPSSHPTRSAPIAGYMTLTTPAFGSAIVGMGKYYADGAGTTLVVSAPGSSLMSSPGRVAAYRMTAGGMLSPSTAQILTQAAGNQGLRFGNTLANLGAVAGALPKLAIGNPGDNSSVPNSQGGTVFVQSGDATAGPFGG